MKIYGIQIQYKLRVTERSRKNDRIMRKFDVARTHNDVRLSIDESVLLATFEKCESSYTSEPSLLQYFSLDSSRHFVDWSNLPVKLKYELLV